jgi:hypothetical protein
MLQDTFHGLESRELEDLVARLESSRSMCSTKELDLENKLQEKALRIEELETEV